jgi:hypothetical protein
MVNVFGMQSGRLSRDPLAEYEQQLSDHVALVEKLLALEGSDDPEPVRGSFREADAAYGRALQYSVDKISEILLPLDQERKRVLAAIEGTVERLRFAQAGVKRLADEARKLPVEQRLSAAMRLPLAQLTLQGAELLIAGALLNWSRNLLDALPDLRLVVPPSLERVSKLRRKRRWLAAGAYVGLVIGLIGFWSPLGVPAGLAGLLWFFVEKRWFDRSDLLHLKAEGRVARELRNAAAASVQSFRDYRMRIPQLDTARLRAVLDTLLVPIEAGVCPEAGVMAAVPEELKFLIEGAEAPAPTAETPALARSEG